jgi:hypothetical protein
MSRYKIWDKKEDIYTPGVGTDGKGHYTATEYINTHAPWAANPNVKVVIGGGNINGTVFMEFEAMKETYKKIGVTWSDSATDEEILKAIEDYEDKPQEQVVTAEERIAAALEYQVLTTIPDATTTTDTKSGDILKRYYTQGLWTDNMLKLAVQKGVISSTQLANIES